MNAFGNKEQSVIIDGPSGPLELLTLSASESFRHLAVICHPHPLFQGTMHNKVISTLARAFYNQHIASVRFNYRGVGKSAGTFGHSEGEVEDLMAVISWAQKEAPAARLILAGFSFGSYIAARGALYTDCDALFCIAPSVENQPYDSLALIPCPLVVVQPEADEVVSAAKVIAWYNDLPHPQKTLQVFQNTSHFFHGQLIGLRTFIENQIAAFAL